ncbi:MAG: Diapolycopene oxygenase [Firmicutes bacterium ADurb.Bin419]|nr:MAG: Diapolycopene oxygenase [Firmicutes bacterium ADurb.Bin419]
MSVLSQFKVGGIGLPVGGAKALTEALLNCHNASGGQVEKNAEVKKVLIEDGKATGIELASGKKIEADIIISACDGLDTIYKLVGEEYIDLEILKTYEMLEPNTSIIQISLGIAKELESEICSINYMLDEEIKVDDKYTCDNIDVKIVRNDHVKLPKGKNIIEVTLYASYDYWMNLRNTDKELYVKEKGRIADIVIDSLDQRFHIKEAIEVIDVSTPATIKNYTNNRNGSILGWLCDKEYSNVVLKKKLSKVKNFYMTGMWLELGASMPASAKLGKDVAHIICHDNNLKFRLDT